MVAVRMMKVAVDQVINVIAMGHGGVTAVVVVLVTFRVAAAVVRRRAVGRVDRADSKCVFFDLVTCRMMQMTIVQVVDMSFMDNSLMAATRAMLVRMFMMMFGHWSFSFVEMRKPVRQFLGMGECVLDQIGNVPIRKRIVQMGPFAAPCNQSFIAQNAEPL
jgi:hypothetical protein